MFTRINDKLLRILSIILFGIYICLLIWVIVFKCNSYDALEGAYFFYKDSSLSDRFFISLIPFKEYTNEAFLTHGVSNLVKDDILNIVVFIPFGLYVTFFAKKRKFFKAVLGGLLLSITFEVIQLFTMIGHFTTMDMITNTIGSIFGYLICRLIYRKNNSGIKLLIFNILSGIAINTFFPLLIYAIFNTIRNFDIYIDIIFRNFQF